MPVYWLALVPIPKSILDKLRKLIFSFLWGSSIEKRKYHLVDWLSLLQPTSLGGWGIKHLGWFSLSLHLKILWMVLKGTGIWHQIFSTKYLKNHSVVTWIRQKSFAVNGVSVIWKGFILTLSWAGRCLSWRVGNGEDIRIGTDPIVGTDSLFVFL